MAPIGTLTLIGLLSNLYTKAGIPLFFVASKTCFHQASNGSAQDPYLLHSRYHLPNIKSGKCFSLVCSSILLILFVKFKSLVNKLATSLSKEAPLFLEFVILIQLIQHAFSKLYIGGDILSIIQVFKHFKQLKNL